MGLFYIRGIINLMKSIELYLKTKVNNMKQRQKIWKFIIKSKFWGISCFLSMWFYLFLCSIEENFLKIILFVILIIILVPFFNLCVII